MLFIISSGLIACESTNSVDGLEDSLSDIPNLNLIEGAEQVVATVNKDRRTSNFMIKLDGMEEKSGIEAGEYAAFCALWDTPINSSNGSYGEVSLHSIKGESYWQGVNYLVNNVDRYFEENEDLTWLEVQIALWSIMDHKKFDMNEIPNNELPSYVRDGVFKQDLIDSIMSDVEKNKSTFDPTVGGNRAYYAQVPDAQDQIIIIPGTGDKEKGFGVRFRNFTNSAAQQEIYLGVGDLGVGSNRSQKHAIFTQNGSTPVDFAYNAGDDELSASAGSDFVVFENLSANMPSNCSIEDIDRAELWVAARDAGTTVTLSGSAMGQPFTVSADGDGSNSKFYTIQNIDVTNGFTISGDITLTGTFSDGERGKVELVLGCPLN
jgi:hypothetical protein